MSRVHHFAAKGKVQIFILLIFFIISGAQAASVTLDSSSNALDSILLRPLPDTIYFADTLVQRTYMLKSSYPAANDKTVHFIHTGNNPDKYPILKHTDYDGYNFFRSSNLFFTRLIFESSVNFLSQEPDVGTPHTKSFKACIFRKSTGSIFKFAGQIPSTILFESCLFHKNSCVVEFNFWNNVKPDIGFIHCTFDSNDVVFKLTSTAFNSSSTRITNSLLSNNGTKIQGDNISVKFSDRITQSLERSDSIYVTANRLKPSDWKLSTYSKAKAFCDTTGAGAPLFDISNAIRGSSDGKYDAGCWALLLGGGPSITTQPKDTSVAEGTAAKFTVAVNGTEPLHYQWYKNSAVMANETLAVLNIPTVSAPTDADTIVEFFCMIKNSIDSATSRVCTLTVVKKPKFTVHPKDSTVVEGSDVSFSAVALRASRYYWISGNDSLANSESNTLSFTSVAEGMNNKVYRCVACNIAGKDTSYACTLTVNGKAPKITTEPQSVTVYKSSPAVFYLVAQGSSLVYTWYKTGNPDPVVVGTNNDSLVIASATENGSYYCVVSNEFGNAKSLSADLVAVDSTTKNPLLIKKVDMVDRRHVRISLQRFDILPYVAGSQPYVDTIGIWYDEEKFPVTPIRDVINFVKIPMSKILESGTPTFEDVIEVNKRECVTYYFVASPFWKNPDVIPPFDTINGVKAFMCSTEPLANPLTLQTDYKQSLGAVDVTVNDIDKINKDSLEYLLVWYAIGNNTIKCDTLKPADLSSSTWSKRYEDALFSGAEAIITFNVKLRGILGNYSEAVQENQSVGTPRTVNYVSLAVDSMRSTSIKLRWSIVQGDNIEKVKIWYAKKAIPVNQDFDTADYQSVLCNANDKEVLIGNLTENTQYYFGLQTYVSGQYWSFVTENSSVSAKTINPGDILNSIVITDLKFDSLTNRIALSWSMDTIGISGMKLRTGFCYDVIDNAGYPSKGFKKVDSTLTIPDVVYFDLDQQFLVDTTYYFSLWLGYQEKDGVFNWAVPENSAKKTLRIPLPGWQKISYFKTNTDSVSIFNHKVVLKPGQNWSNAVYEDTILVFKPNPASLKPGFLPVSMGVDFKRHNPSNDIFMTLTCDSLPDGYSMEDVFMYQYDESTDSISILPRALLDISGKSVTTSFKPHQMHFPFILMIDTQEPVVTIMSDTTAVVSAQSRIIDKVKISDNIINSSVKLYIYRSDDSLFQISSEATSWHNDTLNTLIDSNYVSQNHSVFAFLSVSDGPNLKWINISRKVAVDYNNAILSKNIWSPVYTHSTLNKPDASEALKKISSTEAWKYDNVHFRIFTWNKIDASRPNSWVEYSEQNKALFSFVPGRIYWIKTRETKALNLGNGITFSLKNTYSDIILSAKSFTDFAMPLHFNVVIQDILDSTSQNQELLQSLGFYKWASDNKGFYQTEVLYQSNTVQFNDPRVVLKPDSCYSIYNSSSTDIRLRIPLITDKMSKNRGSAVNTLAKSSATEQWNVTVNSRTDDALLAPVYCGYSPGKGSNCFPVSPSFSNVRAGVLDSDKRSVHGMVVAHEKKANGISYPLVFDNSYSQSKKVNLELKSWGAMPASYMVSIFNPEAGTYENSNNGFNIGAGDREYRYLVVGDETFVSNWKNNFVPYQFSLIKAYPNPFRSRIQIRFMMPYSGVNRISMAIFDQLGRRLWRKEVGKDLHPGENILTWDPSQGSPLASGTYILQITAMDGSGKVKGVKRERIMFMP